jgi:hypothetical protein
LQLGEEEQLQDRKLGLVAPLRHWGQASASWAGLEQVEVGAWPSERRQPGDSKSWRMLGQDNKGMVVACMSTN